MQAGPAGIFSHTEVFSCIYNTLKQVFKCELNKGIICIGFRRSFLLKLMDCSCFLLLICRCGALFSSYSLLC